MTNMDAEGKVPKVKHRGVRTHEPAWINSGDMLDVVNEQCLL